MNVVRTGALSFGLFLLAQASYGQQITMCQGEHADQRRNRCNAYEAFAYCGTAEAEAKRICKELGSNNDPRIVVLRSVKGNKCGYTNILVVCQ